LILAVFLLLHKIVINIVIFFKFKKNVLFEYVGTLIALLTMQVWFF
jgi:hypothetical protein